MKQWMNEHKAKLIVSSAIILAPILVGLLLWNRLPDRMITHWGAGGNPDGASGKGFAVFALPLILLAVHWLCLLATAAEKRNRHQSEKAMGIIFWILPVLSLFVNCMIYAVALGWSLQITNLLPILLGLLFVIIGNILPKVRQNRTLGIKLSWTFQNQENWNKTHRFGGKVWVLGGLALMLSVFLPISVMIWVLVADICLMVTLPILYSYCIYRRHQKEGILYAPVTQTKADLAAKKISGVVVPILLIGIAVLMFTGNITYTYSQDSFTVDSVYGEKLEISYDIVDSLSYREHCPGATRIYGFTSPRLSIGNFENEEMGAHTRYTYTGCDAAVILESQGKLLVINAATPEETQTLYNALAARIKN